MVICGHLESCATYHVQEYGDDFSGGVAQSVPERKSAYYSIEPRHLNMRIAVAQIGVMGKVIRYARESSPSINLGVSRLWPRLLWEEPGIIGGIVPIELE